MQFLEEQPGPDEREFQPPPADVEREKSPAEDREPVEHQPCPVNIRLEKQQLRPSTLPILQRLMKHRSRPKKPRAPERLVFGSTFVPPLSDALAPLVELFMLLISEVCY